MATDREWAEAQAAGMDEGRRIVLEASNEALDYVTEALENYDDHQWRRMVVQTQALEMGIGVALAEHVVPVIYKDMEKNLHKKIKVKKETAEALRYIYIGRVVKNIRKRLNERT